MKNNAPLSLPVFLSAAMLVASLAQPLNAQLPPPPKPETAKKTAPPVPIKGANGKVVNFVGIKAATPKGLTYVMSAGGEIKGITWDKLDLAALKQDHPFIFAAYEDAVKGGKTTELNKGIFEDITIKKSKKVLDGHYVNTISGIRFAIQMPAGTPKGILVLMTDLRGRSTGLLPHGFDSSGHFRELRTKYRLAIMAFDEPNFEKVAFDKVDPLVFADKKSGPALMKAIAAFAKDSGQPSMADAPILLYGAGKTGAAFCYNFVQWKPEQVQAAIVSNGAFYSAKPTEKSAKIPLLFIHGQYNDNPERWKAGNTLEEVFKANATLRPNWINAMEFRGKGSDSRLHDYFARTFLKKMIDLRKVKEKPKPPPEEEKGDDEKKSTADSTDGKDKKEEVEKEEVVEGLQFVDIPRESSYVGDLKTFEIEKIKDPAAPLDENHTWLPNGEIAKMWKAFAEGTLVPKDAK